jgi:hypothetical protein
MDPLDTSGIVAVTSVSGPTDAVGLRQLGGIFSAQIPGASVSSLPAGCAPLPPGHHRRIFFGFSDVTVNNTFALGYEEVDAKGNVVPGTQKPGPDQLERFDPAHTTVCMPLRPGQTPVHETWELIHMSTPKHTLHLHQVHKSQNDVCTIPQWRSSYCQSNAVVLDIPFAELGEFVYHCHILEHEDGGMMARIHVVPSPN